MIDLTFIRTAIPPLLKAVPMTLLLTFVPVALGSLIGAGLCMIRLKRIPVASEIVSVFYSFFRSCPLVVLVFLSYYGLPKLINIVLFGGERKISIVNISNVVVALVALTLYASAFLGEIMRGAVTSVDPGQYEAACSLGFSRKQTFFHIILPQALRIAVPNICNFCIGLLKGSSVVFVIGVIDMMAAAKLQAEIGYRYIEAYLMAAILYVLLTFIVSFFFKRAQARFSRGFQEL